MLIELKTEKNKIMVMDLDSSGLPKTLELANHLQVIALSINLDLFIILRNERTTKREINDGRYNFVAPKAPHNHIIDIGFEKIFSLGKEDFLFVDIKGVYRQFKNTLKNYWSL